MRKLKRQIKALKKAQKDGDSGGGKAKPHKVKKQAKFNRNNPGAHIPAAEWKELTDEQKEAARKARERDGIPSRRTNATLETEETRTVSAVTIRELKELLARGADDDDSVPEDSTPKKLVPVTTSFPPHLLHPPPAKPLVTTQRQVAYQMSDKQQQTSGQSNKKRKQGPR